MNTPLSLISDVLLRRLQSAAFFVLMVLTASLGYWGVLQQATRWHPEETQQSITPSQIQVNAPVSLRESDNASSPFVKAMSDWSVRMPVHAVL